MDIALLDPMPRSLLVVEDSPIERAGLVAMAKAMGVAVVYEAGNGREALHLLGHLGCAPDAMTLDLDMPEMDGIALIEQLHSHGARIPVVVVSGQDRALLQSTGILIEQLGLPFLGVLPKPIDAQHLEDHLRHASALADRPERPGSFLQRIPGVSPTRSELAQAIASGQIHVHYQPKVALADCRMVGVEALARWTHPVHGDIPPDTFIALAERTGLIHPLTMSVLDQALRQVARWNEIGIRLSAAVNLSPRLLDSSDLVEEIVRIQQLHRIAPSQITLEITESSSAHQFISAIGVLARLRLKGFGLSIDDYGTGYSSMQQLTKIPFTELKFDRSFVQGAVRHENHRIILSSSIRMSQALGLVTVAEGIETQAEWQQLKDYGCVVGQGWFIGKPMPGVALPAWMQTRQCRLPGPGMAA